MNDASMRAPKHWALRYFSSLPSLIWEVFMAAVILAFPIPALHWLLAYQLSTRDGSVRDGSFETSMMQLVRHTH